MQPVLARLLLLRVELDAALVRSSTYDANNE